MIDGFIAFYIFLLAAITGYEIMSKAPVKLHTTLVSATSFIHGIALIGAMVVLGQAETSNQIIIGFVAVALSSANVIGGFVISKRMIGNFQQNDANKTRGGK